MSRTIALLWMLVCLAMPAIAQSSAGAGAPSHPLDLMNLGVPAFVNFTQRDGLPDSIITSTCVDREGFVWGASPIGVFRYDGRLWVANDDPAMAHSADSIFVDHQGTLWVAFRNNGLARYDGRQWHVENTSGGLPSDQIRRFAETVDARGVTTLWALTFDRGLMQRKGARWQLDPGNVSLPSDPLVSMAQTHQIGATRRQWVGTNAQGLWYRDEGQSSWQRWEGKEFEQAQIESLLPVIHQGREELWISVFAGGLWRMRSDGLRHWSKQAGELPSDELYNIVATDLPGGDKAVWAATRAGLIRVDADRVQVFDRRNGMLSDAIRDVFAWRSPDGSDILWIATESGISRTALGSSPWSVASMMGADATGVFSFLVEPDGQNGEQLWVSSSTQGLTLYKNGHWRHFTEEDGIAGNANIGMLATTPTPDGGKTYWVGLRGGRLLRMQPGEPRFTSVPTPWRQTTGETAYDTLIRNVDGRREQWFVTRASGPYRLRDGQWTHFPPPDPNGPWRTIRIREVHDAKGRSWLWAATNQGLSRFDGERWQTFARDIGLPEPNLIGMNLIPDAAGRQILWLGTTSAGVTRVDITNPLAPRVLPNDLPPPPDTATYSPQADSKGRIYICTNNGVQQLTPSAHGYVSQNFNRRDGMVHQECNHIQMVDAHDRFWTGTMGGLAVYDPRRALHDTQPKPLKVTGLQIDGHPHQGTSLDVPAGAKEVRIDYALLSWYREADSRFRTQLIGYDPVASDWSEQNFRTFNGLPPGRYTLRIEAHDHAGNASTPVEIAMVLHPQWWQQLWVRIAGIVALLLLGYTVVLLRTRQLRAQRSALEQHIAMRTAELNIANARLVELSYQDALTGLANRRRLLEALEEPVGAATLILLDVDHFKQYNDRFGHLAGDDALRRVAQALRDCAGPQVLVARYGGEEFACLLAHAETDRALELAECIRQAVESCEIPVPGETQRMRVTISAGIASAVLSAPEDALRLLRQADLALYQAKHEGRNRVRIRDADGSPMDNATA